MKSRLGFIMLVLSLVALPLPLQAGKDAVRGAKDHPLLTRYPNSHIVEYSKNFDAVEFAVGSVNGEPKRQRV
jgi:hypothetical protein